MELHCLHSTDKARGQLVGGPIWLTWLSERHPWAKKPGSDCHQTAITRHCHQPAWPWRARLRPQQTKPGTYGAVTAGSEQQGSRHSPGKEQTPPPNLPHVHPSPGTAAGHRHHAWGHSAAAATTRSSSGTSGTPQARAVSQARPCVTSMMTWKRSPPGAWHKQRSSADSKVSSSKLKEENKKGQNNPPLSSCYKKLAGKAEAPGQQLTTAAGLTPLIRLRIPSPAPKRFKPEGQSLLASISKRSCNKNKSLGLSASVTALPSTHVQEMRSPNTNGI